MTHCNTHGRCIGCFSERSVAVEGLFVVAVTMNDWFLWENLTSLKMEQCLGYNNAKAVKELKFIYIRGTYKIMSFSSNFINFVIWWQYLTYCNIIYILIKYLYRYLACLLLNLLLIKTVLILKWNKILYSVKKHYLCLLLIFYEI